MKKNAGSGQSGIILFTTMVMVGLSSCSPSDFIGKKMVSTQEAPVVVADSSYRLVKPDETNYPIYSLDSLFTPYFSDTTSSNNLVIHVHGAGYYPKMAFMQKEPEIIKSKYNADVFIFTWPSFINMTTIPRANANASGPYFGLLLEELNAFRAKAPESYDQKNMTLTLHSMGNDVLKSFLKDYQHAYPSPLFDTVILIAAEVPLKSHAEWLEKLDFANRVVVLMNSKDRVLNVVKVHENQARLGMQHTHLNGDSEPLADNANYVVADHVVKAHKYYIKDHLPLFEQFFNDLINNEDNPFGIKGLISLKPKVWMFEESDRGEE